MADLQYQAILTRLLNADPLRMKALQAVAQLQLSSAFIAAGFLRNLVWDHIHAVSSQTPLNDVDVIYFDNHHCCPSNCRGYETQLEALMPGVRWQVKNQATMHIRNNDRPYTSVIDAMRHWPEKETAVAVQLHNGQFTFISGFGFESLFAKQITWNPAREISVFLSRVEQKQWLVKWPALQVVTA